MKTKKDRRRQKCRHGIHLGHPGEVNHHRAGREKEDRDTHPPASDCPPKRAGENTGGGRRKEGAHDVDAVRDIAEGHKCHEKLSDQNVQHIAGGMGDPQRVNGGDQITGIPVGRNGPAKTGQIKNKGEEK